MNLYDATVPVFTKFLNNLDRWFDKAIAHAAAKKFDPEVFVSLRLAPDQYPLSGQVQTACDAAKFCASKLAGKEAPSHPDTEKTIAELRARIRTCIGYLETLRREDFEGAEERAVGHSWMQGKTMRGGDYLDHWALPNFHFHLTIAYEIFRHNGVPLGIEDHAGELPFRS
jgi:hypothetical protein